jgi:hypothetical protein
MDLSAISLGAAAAVTRNFAALNGAIAGTAQDPSVGSVTSQADAATPAQASMDVLRRSIDLQASTGAQLAALIGSTGVDLTA